ncbi:Uncharacterised protein [Staphylococcus aureus]|nr:Uncharacterised protein [Staphylococcus aureus]
MILIASINEINANNITATTTAILNPSIALSPIIWKKATFLGFPVFPFNVLVSVDFVKLSISTSVSSDL